MKLNNYLSKGFGEDLSQVKLEVEEILFEGKWMLKLLKENPKLTNKEIFRIIEKKKNKNKKICELTDKLL